MELLVFSHDCLKLEYVGQVGRAQVIGEDAPGCMGVADVHVPVAEPRGDHHVARVDHPVSLDRRQLRRLADLEDVLALDDQRAVGDDTALGVHGDDETGAFDLNCCVWHLLLQTSGPLVLTKISGNSG